MPTPYLDQASANYSPLAMSYRHTPRTGMEGLPFMDGSNPLLASIGQPILQQMFGQINMLPTGLHQQNVYDLLRNQATTQAQLELTRQMVTQDIMGFRDSFRGIAAITGTPFGAEQRRAVSTLSRGVEFLAPMLVQAAPDFLDQLAGQRGSAAVMASRLFEAGRFRMDPVTGTMGMSSDSVRRMSEQIFADIYAQGDMQRVGGLRAGQLGDLFSALQSRGLIRHAGPAANRVFEATQSMTPQDLGNVSATLGMRIPGTLQGFEGMAPADLSRLSQDPMVAQRIRSIDAVRVRRTLESYSEAISAMRDIMGDAGNPNAPVPQLMANLEALTAGQMHQMDPGRVARLVQTTYNLSRQTGVSLDSAVLLQQHATQRAAQLNIEPIFGVNATQGSLAFGGAYRALGLASYPAWGAFTSDQAQQLNSNLRVQAAGSAIANRLALFQRVASTVGGFQPGSQAAAIAEAIGAGRNTYLDPTTGTVSNLDMSEQGLFSVLTGARGANGQPVTLTMGDLQQMSLQQHTNREFLTPSVQNLTFGAQGREVQGFIANRFNETIANRITGLLRQQGLSERDATRRAAQIASSISPGVAGGILNLDTETMSSTGLRTAAVADLIGSGLQSSGILNGMTDQQRQSFLRDTASLAYGHANASLRESNYPFRNVINWYTQYNASVQQETQAQTLRADLRAQTQESMRALGQGTLLSRAVSALQDVPAGESGAQAVFGILGSALGGVRNEELNTALLPRIRAVADARRRVDELQRRIEQTPDSPARQQLLVEYQTAQRALANESRSLSTLGTRFGLFREPGATPQDVRSAAGSVRDVIEGYYDASAIRGGLGATVSAAELAEARSENPNNPNLTAEDVLAMRRARPIRATEADIQARITAEGLDIDNPAHAAQIARIRLDMDARQRARRFGFTRQQMQEAITAAGGDSVRGLRNLLEGAETARWDAMSPSERQSEMLRRRSDFRRFWGSESGQMQLESTRNFTNYVGGLAESMLSSRDMVQRFGTRALGFNDTLTRNVSRLHELAAFYAGRDLNRLLAGDLDIDVYSPQGRQIMAEVRSLQNSTGSVVSEVQQGIGAEGRQWGDITNEQLAARIAPEGANADRRATIARYVGAFRQMNGSQENALRSYGEMRQQLQSFATARGIGIDEMVNGFRANNANIMGRFTEADRQVISEIIANQAPHRRVLQQFSQDNDIPIEDVLGSIEVPQLLVQLQNRLASRNNVQGPALAQQLFSEYGLGDLDPNSPAGQDLVRVLNNSSMATRFARRALQAQRDLRRYASNRAGGPQGLAGVSAITADFTRTQTGTEDQQTQRLREFAQRYGLDVDDQGNLTSLGREQLQEIRTAIDFQQHTRFNSVGPTGTLQRPGQISQLLTAISAAPPGLGGSQISGPVQMEGTLSGTLRVDLLGGLADLVSSFQGAVDAATPSGGD